jgi:hypothetical protein
VGCGCGREGCACSVQVGCETVGCCCEVSTRGIAHTHAVICKKRSPKRKKDPKYSVQTSQRVASFGDSRIVMASCF